MPITRAELHEQYKQNCEIEKKRFINDTFYRICSEVTINNNHGVTRLQKDLRYLSSHWKESNTNELVEMLKAHYVDSKIVAVDNTITIDWSLPENDNTVVTND